MSRKEPYFPVQAARSLCAVLQVLFLFGRENRGLDELVELLDGNR